MHLLHNFLSVSLSRNSRYFILLGGEIYRMVTQVNDSLVPAILYQTLYYSLELFWKLCMQVINVLLKRRMSSTDMSVPFSDLLCTCSKTSFWITWVYTFLIFPPCDVLLFCPQQKLRNPIHPCPEMRYVSPQAEMGSDSGNLYITLFCLLPYFWHTVHCPKEMSDYGKLMPFGCFLTRIASCNLMPFIFIFNLHKECKRSLPSYHWDDLGKLERQM